MRKEQHLFQDFRVLSAGLRGGLTNDADVYFLSQHYRLPTRLLDWTLNPLAALYFAAENYDFDGEVFLLDAYQFKNSSGVTLEGISTARRRAFTLSVDVISSWGRWEEFQDSIIPVRPDHIDQRMSVQSSCFTFHTPGCRCLNINLNPSLRYFTVPKKSKSRIRAALALLGVNQFSIFGNLDSLAQVLIEAHQSEGIADI